jgi:hypothetical protein
VFEEDELGLKINVARQILFWCSFICNVCDNESILSGRCWIDFVDTTVAQERKRNI